MMDKIKKKLATRREENAFRTLTDNSQLVDFSSNNYLGLERFMDLKNRPFKINRTGSRLLSGQSQYKSQVENVIANHHKAQSALVFSSGYSANLGLISCVADKEDTIIYDALCHASIRDGLLLSRAKKIKFAHNDLLDLEKKIDLSEGDVYVVIESVYSMDGDGPDLKAISQLCLKHGAKLIVDEAHSVGLYGQMGEGLCVELGIENEVFARVITYGKAFGFHGAAILGNQDLKDYLINFSRPFIYSTAPSDQFFHDIESRYLILKDKPSILTEFREQKAFFMDKAKAYHLTFGGGMSGIYTFMVPGNTEVKRMATSIQESGFDVRPILSPTVPTGSERLRICLHAFNTGTEITGLIENLRKYGK